MSNKVGNKRKRFESVTGETGEMATLEIVDLTKSSKKLQEFLLAGNPKKNPNTFAQESKQIPSTQPTIEPTIWQKVRRIFEQQTKTRQNSLSLPQQQQPQPRDRKVTVWDPRDKCYYIPGNEMTIQRESFSIGQQQPKTSKRQSEDDISKMILMYQMSTYVEEDEFLINQPYQYPTSRR